MRVAAAVLVCLLAIDMVFMALHVLQILLLEPGADPSSFLADPRMSLGTDGGYAEWYGYAKQISSVVVLVLIYRRVRGPAYVAWALTVLVVFVDDFFLVHETLGGEIAERLGLGPAFGLRGQDFGELITWAILGVCLLVVLVIAHRRSAPEVRRDSRVLAALLLALGFFGVVVDMLHIKATGRLERFMGLSEDGGELVVLSVVAAFVVGSMLVSVPPTPGRGRRSASSAEVA